MTGCCGCFNTKCGYTFVAIKAFVVLSVSVVARAGYLGRDAPLKSSSAPIASPAVNAAGRTDRPLYLLELVLPLSTVVSGRAPF